MLEKMFKLTERETSVRQEVIGGLTTFMTMSYIIFVNPSIMADTGMDKGALITITCLSAAIGSLIAAFWANAPLGLAPGMGLNAFFTYTLVIGKGIPWETALGVVFISGLFFLIMSIGGIRERIAQAIPVELKIASTAGIGLFIAFIGLKSMGLIVANPATFVSLGKFTPTVILGVIGIIISALLELRNIKGGMLIGMIITTILGMIIGVVELPTQIMSMPPSIRPIAFKLDIMGALQFALIGPIFSFMFVDLFDSLGTLIACAKEMGMEDEDGNILSLGRMIHTDVASTIIGSLLGSSTVTTLSETTAGIAAGARTGLASVVIGGLFLLSLLFTPIVGIVPAYATAPALIIVGIYMFKNLKELNLHDFKTALPVFATVIMMPLTYSISTGLSFGFLSFIVVHVGTGEYNKVSPVLWGIGGLSLLSLMV